MAKVIRLRYVTHTPFNTLERAVQVSSIMGLISTIFLGEKVLRYQNSGLELPFIFYGVLVCEKLV